MSIIRIEFNDELDNISVPSTSSFTVTDSSTNTLRVTRVSISGREVQLEVAPLIRPGTVTVAYQKPNRKPISDRIGNRVDSFSQQYMAYAGVPALLSGTVDVDSIVLTYSEALDTASVPSIDSFIVTKF